MSVTGTDGLVGGKFTCEVCPAAVPNKVYWTIGTKTIHLPATNICILFPVLEGCDTYSALPDSSKVPHITNEFLTCTNCINRTHYLDLHNNRCIPRTYVSENCHTYSKYGDYCVRCINNTLLNVAIEPKCIPYPTGIFKCTIYTSATTCTRCEAPYYLSGNSCSLSNIFIHHCAVYGGDNVCSQCEAGYYLSSSSVCEPTIALNCFRQTDLKTCS